MIVEELIGRLTLQTKGIDQAKQAVKTLGEFRKALKGLAGSARMNFDGPARIAKSIREARKEAERLAQSQKRLGGGGDFARADASARKHLSTVQKLRTAYVETAKASALIGRRPAGKSWIQDELRSLREYQRVQRQIGQEAGKRGISRREMGRQQDPYRYGRHDGPGLRNPVAGSVDVRGLLDKGFDSAATIPQVQAQMRMRKESEADIEKATKLAYKMSGEIKQFSAAEHLQSIYGSLSIFGDMDKAMKSAPAMQRANALIEGLSDQFTRLKPYKGGSATKDFARVFDMMGATEDPKKMDALGEAMIKSLEQSAGDVTPSDILSSLKMARSARYGFSNDFIQNYLGGIIGDVKTKGGGGQSAGTMLQSFYKNFHDLNAPKYILENMAQAGLIDGTKLARSKKGKITGPGTAEVENKKLLEENPQIWASQVLSKYIEKKKGKLTGDDAQDTPKVLGGMPLFAGERLAKDFGVSAILQRQERERDANITRKMPGIAGLEDLNKAPVGVLQQFTAGITDLFAALAAPAVQPALAAMKSMGDMARTVANFQRENPDAAPIVSGTVGAVGGVGAAGAAVVGKRMLGRILGLGGGKTPGASAAPVTPPELPGVTTPAEASPVVPPKVPIGPQESLLDNIGRAAGRAAIGAAKVSAGAAVGPMTSLTKGDQDRMLKKLGGWAQEQERAKQPATPAPAPAPAPSNSPTAATTTPNAVAAAVPNVGAVQARLSEIQSVTTAGAEKIAEAMKIDGKLNLDTSAIDAAMAKLAKLKAEMASVGSVGAGSGLGGAGLSKGSNTFTSPGATAP